MSPVLEVLGLEVNVGSRTIIRNVSFSIGKSEIAILMGPNGSGKSTLLYSIMGIEGYTVTKGKILLNGEDITNYPSWERARKGVSLAFQNPPKINARLGYLAKKIAEKYSSSSELLELATRLNLHNLLKRRLYHGFSGGETKRTELFLVMLQKPRVALLDEPDSGVDIESIKVIAEYINKLAESGTAVLLVTHQGYILRYIDDLGRGYVMYDGEIICSGNAYDVLKKVSTYGYSKLYKEFRGK